MSRTVLPTQPPREALELTAVLNALSDPVRLAIVQELAGEGDRACGAFRVEMAKSSLSHHFRVLRQSGVVATWREGRTLMNALRRDDLDARFPGLLHAVLAAAPVEGTG
jgi:DNA-binding transcriptional ArsR family regulator